MYLFDTDAISTLFKPRPPKGFLRRLQVLSPDEQCVSTITISEIVYGAAKSPRRDHHLRNLETVLLPAVRILDFDAKAAYVCGTLRAELDGRGTPLDFADLQIASIALANNLILITGNARHFLRVPGLQVENWIAPE